MSYIGPDRFSNSEALLPDREIVVLHEQLGHLVDTVSAGDVPDGWIPERYQLLREDEAAVRLRLGPRYGGHSDLSIVIRVDGTRSLLSREVLPNQDKESAWFRARQIVVNKSGMGTIHEFAGTVSYDGEATIPEDQEEMPRALTTREARLMLDELAELSQGRRHHSKIGLAALLGWKTGSH